MLQGSSLTIKQNEIEMTKANIVIMENKAKITEW